MNIGVDKIQLKIQGVHRPEGYQLKEGWSKTYKVMNLDGEIIPTSLQFFASNLSSKSRNGNLTIIDEPLRDTTSIIFNPTNFFSDYELTTDLSRSMDIAQDIVLNSGLDIDLSSASIRRLDVTKDAVLIEPPQNYNPILSNYLQFRRSSTKVQYQDGLWMGNRSREFTFYDRAKHLDIKKIDHTLHSNTARLEYKLKNEGRKSWSENYGLYTPNDLTNDIDQYNEIFVDGLRNVVLKDVLDGDTIVLSPITLINQLKEYQEMSGRNFLSYFCKDYGLLNLIDNFGADSLIDAIAQVQKSESKVVRSRIKEDISRALKLRQSTSTQLRRPVEYIQEIINQYAKAS